MIRFTDHSTHSYQETSWKFIELPKENSWDNWMGFNVELELRIGILKTVWDLSQRMIRRRAITISTHHGEDDSPTFVPLEV